MAQRFQLAPAVSMRPLPDGRVMLSNGADLELPISAALARALELFRVPTDVEPLRTTEVGPLVAEFEKKMVLVNLDQSHEREMQLVWNYLSQGSVERAIFHIDNESASLEAFAQSGREAVTAMERLVQVDPAWTVVTIGCGMGRIEKFLGPKVKALVAFDISDEMLARAAQYLHDVPQVALRLSDGTLVDVADRSVDLVASFLVLQHVTREGTWKYLAEAGRVLKPGGVFLFQIHCYPEGALTPTVASAVDRYYGAGKVALQEAEIRQHLEAAGLRVDLLRDGASTGDERRLTGTEGPWRSLLIRAERRQDAPVGDHRG